VLLQEVTPQWMLPSKCFDVALRTNPAGAAEPDISDFAGICRVATTTSKDPECAAIGAQQLRYSCSFKSLSSFWQVWCIIARDVLSMFCCTANTCLPVQHNCSQMAPQLL
jgi:hypothetical protein